MILNENTIELWLTKKDTFIYEFKRSAFEQYRAIGIDIAFSESEINSAYDEWVRTCEEWKANKFDTDIESLSYTKILSVLLFCLCKRTYISELTEYTNSVKREGHHFTGTPQQLTEVQEDFRGAPEVICALDFCIQIINFYEEKRIDRKEDFFNRFTYSMRHDFIHYLSTNCKDPLSVYLIIKGIYTRD